MNFASPAPTFRLSRAFLRLRPPPRPTAQMVRSGQKRMRAGDRIVRDDAWWRGGGKRGFAPRARSHDAVPLPLSRGAQRLFYGCRVVAPSSFVLRENRTGKRKKQMAAVEMVRRQRHAASLAPHPRYGRYSFIVEQGAGVYACLHYDTSGS